MFCHFRNTALHTWQSVHTRDFHAKIPKWKRGPLLGSGAYGVVSLAVGTEQGQIFAVKSVPAECHVLPKDKHTQTEWNRKALCLDALQREKEILRYLDSPRVIQFLGDGWSIEDGITHHNVFLEYMPGRSLTEFGKASGGKLEERLLQYFTREILEGLQYLHARGIVHCDIKGRNILLGKEGVKIADFGAAMYIFETATTRCPCSGDGEACHCWHKANGVRCNLRGSPFWMAPEAITSKLPQGTARDIWSLGCTIIELATGACPWGSEVDPISILLLLSKADVIPPVPSSLSPIAQDFLQKCFIINPSDRWTAEQLLDHPFIAGACLSLPEGLMPTLSYISSRLTCHDMGIEDPSFARILAENSAVKTTAIELERSHAPNVVHRDDDEVAVPPEKDDIVHKKGELDCPEALQPCRERDKWDEENSRTYGRVGRPLPLEVPQYMSIDSEATPGACLSPWKTQSWGFGGVQDGMWFVVYPRSNNCQCTPRSSTMGLTTDLPAGRRPRLLRALSTSQVPCSTAIPSRRLDRWSCS